jgi:hypothetical protein
VQDKVSGSAKDKEEASKKFAEISHGAVLQTRDDGALMLGRC